MFQSNRIGLKLFIVSFLFLFYTNASFFKFFRTRLLFQFHFHFQNEPNLRLQGYENFNWKRRKVWRHFETRIKETYSKLELWRGDLKKIEGNFGTGIVAYFLFIKWLLYLNITIFLFILLFVILPTFILGAENGKTCASDADSQDCCSAVYFNQSTESSSLILDLVQGTGKIERTPLFYGFYSNETFSYKLEHVTLYYNLPLAYIGVAIVYFLISLIALVKSAARGFKERLVEGEGQFYQYCNLIFGGWDFCIHNEKSAAIKHKAIYNEIKGLLENERLEEEKQSRTREEKIKLYILRTAVNFVVLCILVACGVGIYFVFDFTTEQLKQIESGNGTSVDVSVTELGYLEQLLYEFLPSLTIVILNIFVPFVFKYLVTLERYSPVFVIRLTLFRTVLLRLSSLFVLYASLYQKVSCKLEEYDICVSSECNTPRCWETFVGQQIYKLVLTDFATNILITFFVNFPRALIARNFDSKFAKAIGEQTFDLPKHVLDVVYAQTLCWVGAFFTPLLPLICTITCFLMFYIKKFACLFNSKPSSTIYRASRSHSMFMLVLLGSYAICGLLPIAYSVSELVPSRSCGPFRGLDSVWADVVLVFSSLPQVLQSIVFFLSTAGFAVPALIVLLLFSYYYSAVNSANRHMVDVLKKQLILEGHDKQFLLNRLSLFIKQQQENQKRMRHAEMMREGERNAASN